MVLRNKSNEKYLRFDNTLLNGKPRIAVTSIIILLEALAVFCAFFFKEGELFHLPWQALVILTVLFVVLLFIALAVKMSVFVFEERIEIKFLRRYIIQKSEISSIEVVKPNAIREFGGWGVRVGIKKRGYIVPGQDAVKVTLTDGTEVVICDDNPVKMEELIRKVMGI